MPDLSLFKPLCEILGITINELLSGERIDNKVYNEKLEENIINTINYVDKRKLKNNILINIIFLILSITVILLVQFINIDYELKNYLTVVSMILTIYNLKQLFMKYKLVRRIVAIILVIICLLSLFYY